MMALITILMPYYNEADFIAATLESLIAQSDRRFRMVLVDNASTDDSPAIARRIAALATDIQTIHLHEPIPGKLNALRAGLAHVGTPYLATCDADTIYPPDYIARCLTMFACTDAPVGVMAIDLYDERLSEATRRRIAKVMWKSRRFRSQCHAGGYAQAFNVQALTAAGGLLNPAWPYVLEDHEVVNRLLHQGRIAYAADHICFPSDRRSSRKTVGWTRWERMVYRFTPRIRKDWFFYRYLGPRLAQRGLYNIALRDRDWS
jgi:glycosyltransferase involved in cell wall biosynthesis